jgi:lipopolysaccharide biosynthesis glycosyltransferase
MIKRLIIVVLVLILFISSKYNHKIEPFSNKLSKYMNNIKKNDYSIVLFFTENLCDEAKNCIKSLEKIGLKNKVVVYALDNNSYQCSKNENVVTKFKKSNLKKEASHGTKDFYEIMYQKLLVIEEQLKLNKVVIYSDTDIVFLKDISEDINKFINSNYDMLFQSDKKIWDTKKISGVCAGFMFLKSNNKVINCIKYAQKLMKEIGIIENGIKVQEEQTRKQ